MKVFKSFQSDIIGETANKTRKQLKSILTEVSANKARPTNSQPITSLQAVTNHGLADQ